MAKAKSKAKAKPKTKAPATRKPPVDPYQGDWDARTLADAEVIKATPGRIKAAKPAAKAKAKTPAKRRKK